MSSILDSPVGRRIAASYVNSGLLTLSQQDERSALATIKGFTKILRSLMDFDQSGILQNVSIEDHGQIKVVTLNIDDTSRLSFEIFRQTEFNHAISTDLTRHRLTKLKFEQAGKYIEYKFALDNDSSPVLRKVSDASFAQNSIIFTLIKRAFNQLDTTQSSVKVSIPDKTRDTHDDSISIGFSCRQGQGIYRNGIDFFKRMLTILDKLEQTKALHQAE